MPKITEMYAFVAEDGGPDDEGVVAFKTDYGWMPAVGADMKRVDSLRPIIRRMAEGNGKRRLSFSISRCARSWRRSMAFENDSLAHLKRWRDEAKFFMDHPRMPAKTKFPDMPGRDWYRANYAELNAEIERREKPTP